MALITGSSGDVYYNNVRIAKCQEFSLDISRDVRETTKVSSYDRSFTRGLRSATGSATVLYDASDLQTAAITADLFSNSGQDKAISLRLDAASGLELKFNAIVTKLGVAVSGGTLTALSFGFQATGAFTEALT